MGLFEEIKSEMGKFKGKPSQKFHLVKEAKAQIKSFKR
jgi:hypothetical protein